QSLTAAFANALNSNTLLATTNNNNNEISEKIAQAINTQIQQQQQTQPAQPAQPTQTTNTVEGVYEYRPTPLAELERRRRVQQYQPPILTTIKSEAIDFDSDDYAHATFSPPSSSPPPTSLVQSEPIEEQKPKISTIPKFQPITSNNMPKPAQPSITDDKHSWVTPPVR
ncbi:unnamed protein product, partial [Adineta steineri]